MFIKKATKVLMPLLMITVGFYAADALATGQSIGDIAKTASTSLENVLKLVTGASYLAGFGLTIGSLFKFKAHKENPTQKPLGECIVVLIIGIALIFLPSLITTGGATLGVTSAGSIGGGTISF